jgi:hypothetical protein
MTALPKHVQLPGNKKVQVIGPSLLESQNMLVGHELDTVFVEIGGRKLTMDYPTAIKLSEMLRTHGKQAKKFAGDSSLHYSANAVLTDGEENYKRGW